MTFDFALVLSRLPAIGAALLLTIELWAASLVAAVVLGMGIALLRRHGPKLLALPLVAFVEVIRGTPFLIQLFLLYFGGPYVGLTLDEYTAGLLALAVFGGCYMSEVFRAGLASVPAGHVEAGICVGLTQTQILRRIVLPEMTVLVLPPLTNIAVAMLKDTAILSVISVPELTLVISSIGSEFFAFVESLTLLSLFYWLLVELVSAGGRFAERALVKYRVPA